MAQHLTKAFYIVFSFNLSPVSSDKLAATGIEQKVWNGCKIVIPETVAYTNPNTVKCVILSTNIKAVSN